MNRQGAKDKIFLLILYFYSRWQFAAQANLGEAVASRYDQCAMMCDSGIWISVLGNSGFVSF